MSSVQILPRSLRRDVGKITIFQLCIKNRITHNGIECNTVQGKHIQRYNNIDWLNLRRQHNTRMERIYWRVYCSRIEDAEMLETRMYSKASTQVFISKRFILKQRWTKLQLNWIIELFLRFLLRNLYARSSRSPWDQPHRHWLLIPVIPVGNIHLCLLKSIDVDGACLQLSFAVTRNCHYYSSVRLINKNSLLL